MPGISIEIDEEALAGAQRELGTDSKVATVNAALRLAAERARVREAIVTLDSIEFDLEGSEQSWRFNGGRDLEGLVERARGEAAEAEAK